MREQKHDDRLLSDLSVLCKYEWYRTTRHNFLTAKSKLPELHNNPLQSLSALRSSRIVLSWKVHSLMASILLVYWRGNSETSSKSFDPALFGRWTHVSGDLDNEIFNFPMVAEWLNALFAIYLYIYLRRQFHFAHACCDGVVC